MLRKLQRDQRVLFGPKVSGPVVYVRSELAIIQYCAMVARNGFIKDVVD